MKTSKIIDF